MWVAVSCRCSRSAPTGVRCLARRPDYLAARTERGTEVVQADLLDRESLEGVLEGIDTAYYLVHSMGTEGSFEERDRTAAENFADAARCQRPPNHLSGGTRG